MTESFNLDDDKDTGEVTVPEFIVGDKSGVGVVTVNNAILVPKMDRAAALRKDNPAGHLMQKVALPDGIDADDFRIVLSGAYLAYLGEKTKSRGAAPLPEDVAKYVSVGLSKIQKIMVLPAFREACEARGIAYSSRQGLTQEQDFALQIILDPSFNGGLEQRLKKAKVPMSKYRAWLKNPVFRNYLESVGGSVLKDFEANMLVALANRASNGDVNAIKYAFEVSGKHDPTQRQVMDGQRLMLQMVEIIKTHVKDPEVLNAIGAELVMLGNAAGLNQQQQLEIEG